MTSLAVIIPTVGRRSLANTLESVASQLQDGDRGFVVSDHWARYDFCCEAVEFAREASADGVTWRCWINRGQRGLFGHGARNWALDQTAGFEDMPDGMPDWCWSIDDDDEATFGAVDMIRAACASGDAPWYVFRMRGGAGSHFDGVTVPTMGETIREGNVGTPMIVFPSACQSRFGVGRGVPREHDLGDGYFGDLTLAISLQMEFGDPGWRSEVVAEIRPVAAEVSAT
jgi:hypothetical protein